MGAAVALSAALRGRRVGVATMEGSAVVQALSTAADAAPSWSSRRRLIGPECWCIGRLCVYPSPGPGPMSQGRRWG